MKPHIKVMQRNGVDVFVTSSMKMKEVERKSIVTSKTVTAAQEALNLYYLGMANDVDINRSLAYDHSGSIIWQGSEK
tara:strand:+ start:7578 stop:7808 length:231 start_codon:yes stop_codon:yes gene_type:complete